MYMMGGGPGGDGSPGKDTMPQPAVSEDISIPTPEKLIVAVKTKVEEMVSKLAQQVLKDVKNRLEEIIKNPLGENTTIFDPNFKSVNIEFGYEFYESAIKARISHREFHGLLKQRVTDIYRLAGEELGKSGWDVIIEQGEHTNQGEVETYPKLKLTTESQPNSQQT